MKTEELVALDNRYVWHPYDNCYSDKPIYPVISASGCTLTLSDNTEVTDAMSSWWCAIHGYNQPALNKALQEQTQKMSHVMFGGLTHEPAVTLAQKLVQLSPAGLDKVFFSDSGSVSVEVALKLALQFWMGNGREEKKRFISFRGGYHGDTFAAMSLCDPVTGMHHLFADSFKEQLFAPRPECAFGSEHLDQGIQAGKDIEAVEKLLQKHHHESAAIIIEPIVQGAGGMRFYSASFLQQLRQLCDKYEVLLIADEIATGFGRSGKMFACEHASISPDIMCVGKALTGGYMTLAATLCSEEIAKGVCASEAGVFMHGPTFMANPLACSVANASIDLLIASPWQGKVESIENLLKELLLPCEKLASVKQARVLGAIGVLEMENSIDLKSATPFFIERGVWIRPFGKLLYTMPPYIISEDELRKICSAMKEFAQSV